MPRAPRVCLQPGCPALTPAGYCAQHARERDATRGRRQARGYGATYDAERREWARRIEDGAVTCWRCGMAIEPGSLWHLGHDDMNRAIIRGAECIPCNLGAAGRKSAAERVGRSL